MTLMETMNYIQFEGILLSMLKFQPVVSEGELSQWMQEWYVDYKHALQTDATEESVRYWANMFFADIHFDTHDFQLKYRRLIKTAKLMAEPIRALWWKQPFGSLMLHDKIETRTWYTGYRGLVLICTSKASYSQESVESISGPVQFKRVIETLKDDDTVDHEGLALAVGRLVDCRPMVKADEDKTFVAYYPELYCHIYESVTPIKPFSIKGCQGWKKLESDIWNQIEFVSKQ